MPSPASMGGRFGRPGAYLFLLPSFLLIFVFTYYPILSAFSHAFTDWDGVNSRFVGLENFARMLRDEDFLVSLPNVFRLALFAEVVALTLPLAAAEVIFSLSGARSRYLYRVLFVVPMVVPFVVVLLIWRFIMDPLDGLLNRLIGAFGFNTSRLSWLASPDTSLFSIMLVNFPWVSGINGFNLLIYLAGLDSINPDIREAALLDGCVGFGRFFRIDLPLISGQVKLIVILTLIFQLQNFQIEFVLTNGGPGNSTMVPGLVMYQNAFQFSAMGYGTAVGLVMAVLIFVLTFLNIRYLRSGVDVE